MEDRAFRVGHFLAAARGRRELGLDPVHRGLLLGDRGAEINGEWVIHQTFVSKDNITLLPKVNEVTGAVPAEISWMRSGFHLFSRFA
jgi:hypothetical protein